MADTVSFRSILQVLKQHGVDFVVIGGVSAVLQGAPVNTFDLDVVHSRDPANIDRLLTALTVLEGRYRTRSHAQRSPDRSHLASPGLQLLTTRHGPLDLLGEVGTGRGYGELLPDTLDLDLEQCGPIRVLRLEKVIALKEERGDEKDRAVPPILKRTLKQRNSPSPPSG